MTDKINNAFKTKFIDDTESELFEVNKEKFS